MGRKGEFWKSDLMSVKSVSFIGGREKSLIYFLVMVGLRQGEGSFSLL
jgi:hypothetical protein